MSVGRTGHISHPSCIQWTIHGFSNLKKRMHTSPSFSFAGSSWRLELRGQSCFSVRRESNHPHNQNVHFGFLIKSDDQCCYREGSIIEDGRSNYFCIQDYNIVAGPSGDLELFCYLWLEDDTGEAPMNSSPSPISEEFLCLEALSADFSALLKDDLSKDVSLLCADRVVRCHRLILGARSSVLKAMLLQSCMVEGTSAHIDMMNTKGDVMDKFVRYLYTAKLPDLSVQSAQELYELADRFTVPSLMSRAASILEGYLSPDNACKFLALSYSHHDVAFKERIIEYIREKEVHLREDVWLPFCDVHPKLANEVLNRLVKFCKRRKRHQK